MAENKKSFRDFYPLSFQDFYSLHIARGWKHPYHALSDARRDIRTYASLFTRDMRKVLLTPDACCVKCGSMNHLEIDHIIPVVLGGKNEQANVQILCKRCHKTKTATEKKFKFERPTQ